MSRILPAIDTLYQHLKQLKHDPEIYRPDCCPDCGLSGLWCHGFYLRKADREGQHGVFLDPVPIPRFYCRYCRKSCSRLPACLPPRRWYLWGIQQVVLSVLIAGGSYRQTARVHRPGRSTLSRWWHRLQACFDTHRFHLCSRFPALGRCDSLRSFWSACFTERSLADAMLTLDHCGEAVP